MSDKKFLSFKITKPFILGLALVIVVLISIPLALSAGIKSPDNSNKESLKSAYNQLKFPSYLMRTAARYYPQKDSDTAGDYWSYAYKSSSSEGQTAADIAASLKASGLNVETPSPNEITASSESTHTYLDVSINGSNVSIRDLYYFGGL